MSGTYSRTLRTLLPLALMASCALFFAYLLARFSYDGLYGQDTYAYYYQAQALWNDIAGRPQPEGALADGEGFRWPIGYHLHIIAGFLFASGPEGGRAITMLLSVAVPVLVYLLVHELWPLASLRARRTAGLAAGLLLLLNGTYARFGLSLMADVPALFWGLLALLLFLKAFPVESDSTCPSFWAFAAGLALGVAVLVRYGYILLVGPVLAYLAFRRNYAWPGGGGRIHVSRLAWVALGAGVALLPQVAYYLTHEAGSGYSAFLGDWNIANILSNRATSADGTAVYQYPMVVFYVLGPLGSSSTGFLSPLLLPAVFLGGASLVRERQWAVLGLLASWWLIPALVFSGTPYQAHRFVIFYLPALTIAAGIGIARAMELIFAKGTRWGGIQQSVVTASAVALLLAAGGGAIQGWRGAERWVGIHASFKEEEARLVALAREAAGVETPRVVSFGMTAAIHYYTRWPILDFYNHDEQGIENFFKKPGARLVVLPEESMSTQWAGTPSGMRWEWMREHYLLERQGQVGTYTVYRVADKP